MEALGIILQQYGLATALAIGVLYLAYKMLDKLVKAQEKEREAWMKLVDQHFESQKQAHEYQREEHKEMLDVLKSMNGRK